MIVFSSSFQHKNNLTKHEVFFVFGLWLKIISRLWKKSVGFLLPISSFLHVISDAVILDPSEKKTSDFQENIWHPLFNASSLNIFSTILSPSQASYSLCRQTVKIVSEKVSGKEFDIKRERRFVHDCLHLKFLCTFYHHQHHHLYRHNHLHHRHHHHHPRHYHHHHHQHHYRHYQQHKGNVQFAFNPICPGLAYPRPGDFRFVLGQGSKPFWK